MVRSTTGAAAVALMGVCLGGMLPTNAATAQDTSELIAKMKRSFGAETAPTDGISEAEAVQIALNRGAAIRMAREEGIFLTHAQVQAIGLEPLELASLAPLAGEPAPAPLPAAEVTASDPTPAFGETPLPDADAVAEDVEPVLPPALSPRPRTRPLTLAAVVAETEALPFDDTTSITTSGDTLFWRVTAERVNLRAGPGTEHEVIAQVGSDAQVLALSDTGLDWVEIQLPRDGTTAWISAQFLEPADS